MIRPPIWPLLAVLLLGGGCATESDAEPDSGGAEQALLEQRDAVEETAQGLVEASHEVLGGQVLESRGAWEGCTSRFPEGYEDFRYTADVRLQARPGTPEDLGAELQQIGEASGYDVATSDSEDGVRLSDGSVTATLQDIPDLGAEGDVLIRMAAGPCVEVSEDQSQDWMSRDDPGPDVS